MPDINFQWRPMPVAGKLLLLLDSRHEFQAVFGARKRFFTVETTVS